MKKEKHIKFGELFCGPGGLAIGAHKVTVTAGGITYKIKHAWSNDYDKDSCNTYRQNICPNNSQSVVCMDVKDFISEELEEIEGFAYGFPCNDFSLVGEQKGLNGTYGPLYTYGIKIINRFNPLFFVAENVGGIKSANEGSAFRMILNELGNSGNGYNLTAHLYKAEEYGVPQTRHRVIIVGFSKKSGLFFRPPKPTHTENNYKTAQKALEYPPIPKYAANQELTKQSETVIERLKYIKPGENAWTADIPENLRLNVKGAKLSQIYKRLDPNKPAYTITGSGGGGTHVYHWKENRALTNRERARLQTFPDDFAFSGSKESVRKQIGMAVPPKLAEVIFEAILKTIAGVKYESIENGNLGHLIEELISESK